MIDSNIAREIFPIPPRKAVQYIKHVPSDNPSFAGLHFRATRYAFGDPVSAALIEAKTSRPCPHHHRCQHHRRAHHHRVA